MDEVKEAFLRVKEDIEFLYNEINSIKEELKSINLNLLTIKSNRQTDKQTDNSTIQHIIPTIPTHNPAYSTDFKVLKPQILGISTGNEGVPTDKQTNRQTDQHMTNSSYNQEYNPRIPIENALEVLNSLDSLKKEIRLKFKRLTDQEMSVFEVLYQLSEEDGFSDYKALSLKLNLTESSIRDYIGRLIKKGIPVEKTKINNKSIQLSISPDLKRIASLQSIIQLRSI